MVPRRQDATPPRLITPGDIVVAYSHELGEWTAAQVTHLDPEWRTAGVVDLDWSGPKPTSVGFVGPLRPLHLTHHAWTGKLSHCNYGWLLPRSCQVIGRAPLLVDRPSNMYSAGSGWRLGSQLASQRRWDATPNESGDPGARTLTGAAISELTAPDDGVRQLTVERVVSLDCSDVVRLFPNLVRITLTGELGTLHKANALNDLAQLRLLSINNLFGMTAAEAPDPSRLTHLDALYLHSVPSAYASAVRKVWTPEIERGTALEVSAARAASWVAQNRDNPLREWDGREHISAARYKKAVAQYRTTRSDVLAALSGVTAADQLAAIGREYGNAFNQLDGSRSPFIETEEREDLFAAVEATVEFAESQLGQKFPDAKDELISGLETVRSW